MDIITNYIESMFAGVPVNEQTMRLREDITANMCDKYDELVKEGKSVNEAIGTVISEFGNIDEVLIEMGISRDAPVPVQIDDPAAMHRSRIRLFGTLSGVGIGALVLGISFVSGFAVRGYASTGFEFFGLVFVLAGVMMIIASLLLRTKILVSAGNIPDSVVPFLRAAYEKSRARHYKMKMVFGGLQIVSFLLFAVSDMYNEYSLNSTITMIIAVSCAFGAAVGIRISEHTFARVLGEEPRRFDVRSIIGAVSVPFFAFAVMFSKLNAHYGGSAGNSVYVMWSLAVVYMAAQTIGSMFEATRRNYERKSAPAIPAEK